MDNRVFVLPKDVYDVLVTASVNDTSRLLAESLDTGITISAEIIGTDMEIVVCDEDMNVLYHESVLDRDDAESTLRRIYDTYLTSRVFDIISPLDPYDIPGEKEAEIEARESSLDTVFQSMLMEVLELDDPYDMGEGGEFFDLAASIKELTLTILSKDYGLTIRRPSMITGPDGHDVYTEYPYEA